MFDNLIQITLNRLLWTNHIYSSYKIKSQGKKHLQLYIAPFLLNNSSIELQKITMSLPGPLPTVFDHIEKSKTKFIEVLREAVAIKSISTDVTCRDECTKMVLWTKKKLEALGATVELKNIGTHVIDGKTYPLPDVIVGYLGNVSTKRIQL